MLECRTLTTTTELFSRNMNACLLQTTLVLCKQRLFMEKEEDIVGPKYILLVKTA